MPHDEHDHDHDHDHDHVHDHDFRLEGAERNPSLKRGSGRGKLLFIDAFSGAAGDMLLSALFDLGVPRSVVDDGLATLGVGNYRLEVGFRVRHSIRARALRVVLEGQPPQRRYADIVALLDGDSGLTAGARSLAQRAFRILAEAEANVHGMPVADVHFHEVGAVDSIVDTVGTCIALDYLGAEVRSSPLPLSRGFTRSQHGRIPLPAPATLLCLTGVPTVDAQCDRELVTPTGACLIKAASTSFERWPTIVMERVGYGAGSRALADRPNVVRLVLGAEDAAVSTSPSPAPLSVLEVNLDDATGELSGYALERALAAGALDSWSTPIGMKKGRPAVMVSALIRTAQVDEVARLLLSETTSLGVRIRPCARIERPRRVVTVDTRFGPIEVKVAEGDGLPVNIAPEYESCRAAAEARGVALKEVYAEALLAYRHEHTETA